MQFSRDVVIMSSGAPSSAPVLSTPDTQILEKVVDANNQAPKSAQTDNQLWATYEIQRTLDEIVERKWQRIALQFPDDLLVDAPRIYRILTNSLQNKQGNPKQEYTTSSSDRSHAEEKPEEYIKNATSQSTGKIEAENRQVYILGDTSYGACCVDEIAAEHVNADGVVHYGRSCLSPTARLPVIYVFTRRELDIDVATKAFQNSYEDLSAKVLLMADTPYTYHLPALRDKLIELGYSGLFATEIVHNPNSLIPNRTIPTEVKTKEELKEYDLFHVSQPPEALLLTLSSIVKSFKAFSCDDQSSSRSAPAKSIELSSAAMLRRRYALVTKLSSCSVFGILINTLSIKNYLHIANHVKEMISKAGKRAYTFVVGKINPAKVANFSEIEGWVVIGCWESSLIESKEFWRPIITPFELEIALQNDEERLWTGEWTSDFQAVLQRAENTAATEHKRFGIHPRDTSGESKAPEFDLRTGKLITRTWDDNDSSGTDFQSSETSLASLGNGSRALTRKTNGTLSTRIGGEVSPAADFLHNKRTWQGLGSDFVISYDDTPSANKSVAGIEEGSSGLAKGYTGEKAN